MKVCLDSSALAKRYIDEEGTPRVLERCRKASEIVLSVLCLPEVVSALCRFRREGKIEEGEYERIKKDVIDDFSEATVVEISPGVLQAAVRLLEKHPLRASDAVQISSAVESSCDLFLSADESQCLAATSTGLKAELIGAGPHRRIR